MNKTIKILIFHALVAIVLWGAYIYFFAYIKSINTESAEIGAGIVSSQQDLVALKNLREKVKEGSDQNPILDQYVIRADQSAEIIQRLESYGAKTGVKVQTQNVTREGGNALPAGSEYLHVSLGLDGGLNGVLNYNRLIESLPFNVKISRVSFSTSQASAPFDGSGALKNSPFSQKWNGNIDLYLVKFADKSGTAQ